MPDTLFGSPTVYSLALCPEKVLFPSSSSTISSSSLRILWSLWWWLFSPNSNSSSFLHRCSNDAQLALQTHQRYAPQLHAKDAWQPWKGERHTSLKEFPSMLRLCQALPIPGHVVLQDRSPRLALRHRGTSNLIFHLFSHNRTLPRHHTSKCTTTQLACQRPWQARWIRNPARELFSGVTRTQWAHPSSTIVTDQLAFSPQLLRTRSQRQHQESMFEASRFSRRVTRRRSPKH